MQNRNIESFGSTIRKLREEKKLPLRIVSGHLNIDQAILSKIENGKRKATRSQITKLANYFNVEETELVAIWLADKVLYELKDEDSALKALQMAEQQVAYKTKNLLNLDSLLQTIQSYFIRDDRVEKAWIFGSFAREEQNRESDIDIMVRFSGNKRISMFDIFDIAFQIEKLTSLKVDLVEENHLEPHAWEAVKHDLIKIYG
ncbi:MAG: nucleotidyltransferase domain-containing protein [Sphingobacteriaceae bacterium]